MLTALRCAIKKGTETLKIGTPKEVFDGENRVAMTPDSALQLQKLGHECLIEAGAGANAGFSDAAYAAAGVTVVKTAAALWKEADIIAKVRQPDAAELKRLSADKTLISFFNPAGNEEGMDAARKKAQPLSRWKWFRVFHVRKKWTRFHRWQTSRAIAL